MRDKYLSWRYLGLSPETVNMYADQVYEDNIVVVKTESLALSVITLVSGILLTILGYDVVKQAILLGCCILFFGIHFLAKAVLNSETKLTTRNASVLIAIFLFVLFFLVISVGTYKRGSDVAALMPAALFLAQVSFDMFPRRNLVSVAIPCAVFIVFSYLWKETSVFVYDTLNITTTTILGLIVSWQKSKNKWEHAEAFELVGKSNSRLYYASTTDVLTGLMNRRQAFDKLEVVVAQCTVSKKTVTCMIMDIDRFKLFNDNYGHPVGDELLRGVGKVLLDTATKYKLCVSRIGGEEFMAFWADDEKSKTSVVADEIRDAIRQLPHPEKGKCTTISIGVYNQIPGEEDSGHMVYDKADRALYEAKKNGRDRVEYHKETIADK